MSQLPSLIHHILECLKKQKGCYTQMLALARLQKKAIDQKNDQELIKALQDKNSLLLTLQGLDEEIQSALKNLSNSDRTLLTQKGQALIDEAARVLEELIAVENTCSKILNKKKEDIVEQMKVFQERKQGLKGYGESGGKSSRFSQEG